MSEKLKQLYQQMYELTEPLCSKCTIPYSCCSPEYCGLAIEWARDKWGQDITPLIQKHPTLPFMGETGCVLPPHFRPLCTLHVCSTNSIAIIKLNGKFDLAATHAYFYIRSKIEELEYGET